MPRQPAKRISRKQAAAPDAKALSAAESLNHPTIPALKDGLAQPSVAAWLAKMKRQLKPVGGLQAYDAVAYEAEMKRAGEYTCVLSALDVEPTSVTHALVPALTACHKVKDLLWSRDKQPLLWGETIYVASFSKTSKPPTLEPLNQDVARLSFWFCVIEAVLQGWEDELELACSSMKVTFKYCASAEAVESEK